VTEAEAPAVEVVAAVTEAEAPAVGAVAVAAGTKAPARAWKSSTWRTRPVAAAAIALVPEVEVSPPDRQLRSRFPGPSPGDADPPPSWSRRRVSGLAGTISSASPPLRPRPRRRLRACQKRHPLINETRLVQTFLDLVAIDSPSGQEQAVGAELARRLAALGGEIERDASTAIS